jgi:hypothetical protein
MRISRECIIFRYDMTYGYDSIEGGIHTTHVIATTYYDVICFGSYDDYAGGKSDNSGGGNGGGEHGNRPTDGKKNTEEQAKTDCERYADALVQSASDFREKYSITGSNRFGIDLYYRANKSVTLSSFGLAPAYSGFKNELVSGGQNHGVYRHVSAALGISLAFRPNPLGLILSTAETLMIDLPQHILGNTEAMAEMKGNIAGIMLVPAFSDFFGGHQQTEQLRSEIKRILCGK